MKKSIAWLLVAVFLWTAGLTAFAYDSTYLNNTRFQTLTKSQAAEKYTSGEKFILYCYRTTCTNCQYIGSTAVTGWMNDNGQNVYGVDVDADGMPSFAYSYLGTSITLPGVLFINNKNASAYSLNQYASLGAMKTALDTAFASFAGTSSPTFSLGSAECKASESVDLPVTISGNPGICTAKLTISYNTSVLELTSVANGSVLTNGYTPGGSLTAVPFNVVWNSGTSASGANGTMVTFTFKVKSGVAGGTKADVSLSYSLNDTLDENLDPVVFETRSGSITVKSDAPTLSSIAVKTQPTKTQYFVGESFNQTGLTLTATYSDGSTKTILSGFTCSGFSSTTAGAKTITVSYEGIRRRSP